MRLLIAILALLLITGCRVTKQSRSKSDVTENKVTQKDSTVSTSENNNVKRTDTEKINQYDRATYHYSYDTTINKIYPTTIIYEKGDTQEKTSTIDSTSLKTTLVSISETLQSVVHRLEELENKKQTKVLGFWDVLGIAIGVGLVIAIILIVLIKTKKL